MNVLAILVSVLLFPLISEAAYLNPTVVSNDQIDGGFSRIGLMFTGNAGEPQVRKDFVITDTTTATSFRNWVDETIRQLDGLRTAATLPSLQVGQVIPRLARTTPAPTAKQVWQAKLHAYMEVKDAGITAANAELAAMKADLESTYQSGFLAP